MKTTLERLREFIDNENLNISNFEKIIGFSNGSLASQIRNKKTIGVDKLEKILKFFPNLSAEWLLTGKGEMLNNGDNSLFAFKNQKTLLKSYVDNDAPLYLERHAQKKLALEFMKGNDEKSKFYQNINTFLLFQYYIMNLDHYYFEKIDIKIHQVSNYYDGKTFDFEKYRLEVINEIEKYLEFAPALEKLIKAIEQFYEDVKPLDKENYMKDFFF